MKFFDTVKVKLLDDSIVTGNLITFSKNRMILIVNKRFRPIDEINIADIEIIGSRGKRV